MICQEHGERAERELIGGIGAGGIQRQSHGGGQGALQLQCKPLNANNENYF